MEADATKLDPDVCARLLLVVRQLSYARDLDGVIQIVKRATRELLAAEGVTFVLRDDGKCFYVDEDAIAPLWKGQRFPANACISGWSMIHRETVAIEDVYADSRIPHDVYRQTFVKSLLMVPVRREDPLGAIGVYWASSHRADANEMLLVETLADSVAMAISNVELLRKLEDAIRLREEFIVVASHELRTPLTPLRLHLDALAKAADAGRQIADLGSRLGQARSNLGRLETLVATLLDQAHMWSTRLVLNPSEVDLFEIVGGVVKRFQARAEQVGVALKLEDTGVLRGVWDPERLDQAIGNLVDNALKFGRAKPVVVRVEALEHEARVIVTDQGIGIAGPDQLRIFDRFERAADRNQFGGFGLGLWITREIVSVHGGHVGVQSAPGQGATFTVSLPRTETSLHRGPDRSRAG